METTTKLAAAVLICTSAHQSISTSAQAQNDFHNTGSKVVINTGETVFIKNGGFSHLGDTLHNKGLMKVDSTFTNSGVTKGNGKYHVKKHWISSGEFIPGTDTVFLDGDVDQDIFTAAGDTFTTLYIAGTKTKKLTTNIHIKGDVYISTDTLLMGIHTANRTTVGGMLTVADGSTMKCAGTAGGVGASNLPANFSTYNLIGRVGFNGTDPATVPALQFATLTMSNSGNRTFAPGIIKVSKKLELLGTNNFTVDGDNTVEFNGTTDQDVPAFDYQGLKINGGGTKFAVGDLTVNGVLEITTGSELYMGAFPDNKELTVRASFINDGSYFSDTTTIFDGTTTITGTSAPEFNDIRINTNKTLTGSSDNLFIQRHWENNGTYNHNSGNVTFFNFAADTQRISGTSITTFNNLTMDHFAGAIALDTAANIIDSLKIHPFTSFVTTDQDFTLLSTAAKTARIGVFDDGSANIIGGVVQQRLTLAGAMGWQFLTSAVDGRTLADWEDDFYIGYDGSDFTTIYSFVESNPLSWESGDDGGQGHVKAVASTDPIGVGQGFWVWLGYTQLGTTPDTLVDVKGDPNRDEITFSLSYTAGNNDAPEKDGWNLLANPFPSQIDWDANDYWTKTDVDDAVYIYNEDIDGYANYVAGVSDPVPASGGINNIIPSSQGFFVRASSSFVELKVRENAKTSDTPSTFRGNSKMDKGKVFRIALDGTKFHNETVIRIHPKATNNFDGKLDAHKMFSMNPLAANICSQMNGKNYSINSIPELTKDVKIPVRVYVGTAGSYKISTPALDELPASTCLGLEDLKTGKITDLKVNNSYSFEITDLKDTALRFIIHLSAPLDVAKQTVGASCKDATDGMLVANPKNGSGPWNYSWKDITGKVVRTITNSLVADTLKNIAVGNYLLELNKVNGCGSETFTFVVGERNPVVAVFTAKLDVKKAGQINLTNNSTDANEYLWDFGDGITSKEKNPTHQYATNGDYEITLTAFNIACGTSNVTKTTVSIINITTGISDLTVTNTFKVINNVNGVFLKFDFDQASDVLINVTNALGQRIIEEMSVKAHQQTHPLNLSPSNAMGMYFISVTMEDKVITQKLVR